MSVSGTSSALPGNLSGNAAPASGHRGKHVGSSKAFEAAVGGTDGTNARKFAQPRPASLPGISGTGARRHAAQAETGPETHHDRAEDHRSKRDEPDPSAVMPQPMASLLEDLRRNRIASGSGSDELTALHPAEEARFEADGGALAEAKTHNANARSTDRAAAADVAAATGSAAPQRTPAQDATAKAVDRRAATVVTPPADRSRSADEPRANALTARQADQAPDDARSLPAVEVADDRQEMPASLKGMGALRSALAALDMTSAGMTEATPEDRAVVRSPDLATSKRGTETMNAQPSPAGAERLADAAEQHPRVVSEEAARQETRVVADPALPDPDAVVRAETSSRAAGGTPPLPSRRSEVVSRDASGSDDTSSTVSSAQLQDAPASGKAEAAGRSDRAGPPSSRSRVNDDGSSERQQRFETRAGASQTTIAETQAGQPSVPLLQNTTLASAVDGLARLLPAQPAHAPAVPGQPLVPAMPGTQSLKIQLRPESLGLVTATLRMQGDKLNVEMTTEKAEAYDRLKGETHALAKSLREMGLQVDQIVVQPPQTVTTPAAQADAGGSFSNLTGQRDQQGFASGSNTSDQGGTPQRGQARGENDNGSQARQPASSINDARSGGGLVI